MTPCKIISVSEYQKLCQHKTVTLIDIRSEDEFAKEHIAGAINKTVEQLSPDCFAIEDVLVFHCQAGIRTQQAASSFAHVGAGEIYILDGGLNAWKKAELPTLLNQKAPLPIMRQVQIIVGFMVILGVVLGVSVSPYFHLLSAFFGAGLLFAGLSGNCALASLLMKLPYNRPQA